MLMIASSTSNFVFFFNDKNLKHSSAPRLLSTPSRSSALIRKVSSCSQAHFPPSVAPLGFAEEARVMLLENSGNEVLGQVGSSQLRHKASRVLSASSNVCKIHQLNTQSAQYNQLTKWLSPACEPSFSFPYKTQAANCWDTHAFRQLVAWLMLRRIKSGEKMCQIPGPL